MTTTMRALGLAVALAAGACGPAATSTPAARTASPVAVGADCRLPGARVQWHEPATEATLTHLYVLGESTGIGGELRDRVDAPVVPSISGVAAPASWVPELARSLSARTGDRVHALPPTDKDEEFTIGVPGRVRTIAYLGVVRISAAFTVHCAPSVRGTFTSWTAVKKDVVPCGRTPPADPLARRAHEYCAGATPPAVPSLPPGEFVPD